MTLLWTVGYCTLPDGKRAQHISPNPANGTSVTYNRKATPPFTQMTASLKMLRGDAEANNVQ
ncbi:MAG: hypothetical protein ACRDHN_12115 [Thermomicrobiales bacterium]